jgi:hypothetical protein
VPFGDREAYYYAMETISGQHDTLDMLTYQTLADPWSYVTYRPSGGYARESAPHPDGCNTPALPSRTVMLPRHYSGYCRYFSDSEIHGDAVYQPSSCSDFADEGPWSSLCANADAGVYFIPPPPGSTREDTPPVTGHYDVWLVNSARFGEQRAAQADSLYFGLWPLISPYNGDANISADQRISETNNVLGEADSMRYEKNMNDSFKVLGVPHWPEMESGGLTYIGVIDGV